MQKCNRMHWKKVDKVRIEENEILTASRLHIYIDSPKETTS